MGGTVHGIVYAIPNPIQMRHQYRGEEVRGDADEDNYYQEILHPGQ